MAGMSQATISNILTAQENKMKASLAFDQALRNASSQREAAMLNLGVDVTNMAGKVLSPDQVGDLLGPEKKGTLKGTTMTTGFGDTTIPTLVKGGVGAVGEAVGGIEERGIVAGGLAGQQRALIGEATDIEKQKAIQEAQAAITAANAEQVSAFGEKVMAEAAVKTAQGQRYGAKGKPKGQTKDLNIWGGKVHDAKGKTIRDATKKEIAAVKAKNQAAKKKGR